MPVNSIVGAMDHRGRNLDVQTLNSLEWKVVDNAREQSPCIRGKCYLPSLEICHAYRLLTEHADGSPNITSLPAFDPSKHKELRASRVPDSNGVHMDMMYCEFKGCTIMVYGKVTQPPIGTNRFPGWDNVSRPARSFMSKGKGGGRSPSKGKSKGQKKGKGKGDQDDTPSREDRTKSDPKGPSVVPPTWKDKDYDDIPIVQDARPADHYVEAYLQGTSDIPTFRVVWITSMGTLSRSKMVSPNRFGDSKLWKTPDEEPGFWEPCQLDQGYATLSPGEDECCRMCPNTDADELIPCAWCNSWAHYRCTYAVGPGRACASHFKVLNPLDKIVVARDDDSVVPAAQKGRQVFPNCCHPRVSDTKKGTPSNVHYTTEAYWVFKHAWRGVGAYYQKGDHVQKKKTGNAPVEIKALKMFPDWERWITPRTTFLSDQLLKEAATLEEQGETRNRVKSYNVFEHYHEGFQPHTLPNPPMAIQSFKDTAKAKQARSMVEEKGKKGGKGKERIPSIPKQALATTAGALATKVHEMYTNLRPKDRRTIQSQAHDWYKAIYHTKFHMTKSQYLDCLCDTAIRFLDVKEPDQKFKELMTKALTSLKAFVDDPTTAGLPNPNQAPPLEPIGQKRPAAAAASQGIPRVAKAKTGLGTYADAITGKSTSLTLPIGAKSAPPKTPAKFASGAIGAPVPPKEKAKAKPKNQGSKTPIGASSTVKQSTAKQSGPVITPDTALEYLKNSHCYAVICRLSDHTRYIGRCTRCPDCAR